jgi:hypothetical protein
VAGGTHRLAMHPYDNIPELAGLATYASAAVVGWSVDENVRRLLRLHWTERRLMRFMVARIAIEPVWEVKCALALHQWHSALRIDELRARIAEMRSPVPRLDVAPDGAADVDAFLDGIDDTASTHAFVSAVYGRALRDLARAYREHLVGCNPLVDHPTTRLIRTGLPDLDASIEWGERALAAITSHDTAHRPLERSGPFHPRRDERFHGRYNFEFAPHVVYNMPGVAADERNLALLCKRTLEMDVPEMMASFMSERADAPWEFHRDYSRQLWDEARHAMMGSVALEARGVDWKHEVPLNVSFALRLNLHATALERQIMLFAIEQSLMPGDTGKRFEHDTAVEAGDALSAHFHDYDWADEVLHAQIGRRAMRREGITVEDAQARAREIHDRTWAALEQYKQLDEQRDWWPEFVRRTLGHESGAGVRPALKIFAE